MEADRVILEPLTTEKAERLRETQNVVAFRVSPKANKIQIRRAVELVFDVKVEAVRVVSVRPKPKRQGFFQGRTSAWKKAYVKLRAGESIELIENL